MKWSIFINILNDGLRGIRMIFFSSRRDRYGYIDKTSKVYLPGKGNRQNVFLYKNTIIHEYHKFISHNGKFIMKENSIAASGLTVITNNHSIYNVGDYPGGQGWSDLSPDNVIIEEDVWIGANVTLCPGTHINRGAVVAAGSVCTKSNEAPPYSIVGGNPAKFIKFKFTLEEQIEHEKIRFSEDKRIDIDILTVNYKNYQKRNR